MKYSPTSAAEAVKIIKSNDRVFVHTAAAAPTHLLRALTARHTELKNVEMVHLHIDGEAPYAQPEYRDSFHINSLFIGANVRKAMTYGQASYVPVFLSEVPLLFRRKVLPLDVALINVSPPDRHGYCSLGVSVDATRAAVDMAKHVIAQINPQMPRTHGDGLIHVSELDAFVECDEPIYEHASIAPNEIEMQIGQHVASLIEDGSTLQTGIGAIPNAALKQLTNHKDLGIHTEMFSDGILELVDKGVITGKRKKYNRGKIISGFAMGTRKLYDFMHDNPLVQMNDIAYVNDVGVIRKNPKMVAINSAIEVDLSGQVCADSIGTRLYSGVGGQVDFLRGAAQSEGGKAIIALPSTTKRGESRIVGFLKPGAGVTTTRAHVHYIITEHGIAHVYGKNIHQRAKALIQIAHPDHREELEKIALESYQLSNSVF